MRCSSMVEHSAVNRTVAGSSPAAAATERNPMSNNHNTQSRIASQLLRATLAEFDSRRQRALATLDIYLHKPIAIGDHADLVSEIVTATKELAEAEEAMAALERHFLTTEEESASFAPGGSNADT